MTGRRYAQGTTVGVDVTQQEISSTLRRYGADGVVVGWEGRRAILRFRFGRRVMRFDLVLPAPDDPAFARTPSGRARRSAAEAKAAYEAEVRRVWRVLLMVIKAKLEVVQLGLTTVEEEFLAYLELPDGTTAGARVIQEFDRAWDRGIAPRRLLELTAGDEGDEA